MRTRRHRPSRASWALTALIGAMPLWWALGAASFIWIVAAVPMLVRLLRRWPIRAPRCFGLWMLFVAWMLMSVTQVEGTRYISFGYRALLYISVSVMFLYVFNLTEDELPRAKVLKLATLYFIYAVIGGYLGLMLGETGFTSLTERLLPGVILDNEFARTLVRPTFAQEQDFLGFALPRPVAPFTFTNEWGSAMAFLVPMVLAGWGTLTRRWNAAALVAMIAGAIPAILSVNRGLWLGVMVGVIYGAVLLAKRGDARYLKGLALGALAIMGLILIPPINDVVVGRLESPHSNNARLTLYGQVIEQIDESPWFGFGAPKANEENPNLPAVGTHGQFWMVLFSHGIPGAVLYVAFSLSLAYQTLRDRDATASWLHVVTAIVPILMWFYELLTPPTFIIMMAGAVALRPRASQQPDPSAQPPRVLPELIATDHELSPHPRGLQDALALGRR